MRESEANASDVCLLCGEDIDAEDVRNYYPSASTVVCAQCARRCGGVYDSERERWAVLPQVASSGRHAPREEA